MDKPVDTVNYSAADAFMAIFGFRREERMEVVTVVGKCPSCGCGLFSDGTNGGHSVADCQIFKLENQRDKLLEALEAVNKYACERFGPGGDRDGMRMPKDYQPDCIQAAMELIAEIKATK